MGIVLFLKLGTSSETAVGTSASFKLNYNGILVIAVSLNLMFQHEFR